MTKRLPIMLLALCALALVGGCAMMEPAYRYNPNAGGGYYSGQSPYGNADTVVYGSAYSNPWGWGGYGPGWGYYGPGGWGYGGIGVGFGATYILSGQHHRRHYRSHRSWNRGRQHHRSRSYHRGDSRHRGHQRKGRQHHRDSRR